MFKTIEKNYTKNLRETKFNKFYWITSILLILSSSLLQISDNIKPYFIYILLLIFVIGYFIINYKKKQVPFNVFPHPTEFQLSPTATKGPIYGAFYCFAHFIIIFVGIYHIGV